MDPELGKFKAGSGSGINSFGSTTLLFSVVIKGYTGDPAFFVSGIGYGNPDIRPNMKLLGMRQILDTFFWKILL